MLKKRNPMNEKTALLASRLGLSEDIAAMLFARGVQSAEEVDAFFCPSANMLLPPELISGMTDAVNRIKIAIENHEKILIFGDYDCDGITAVAILKLYLESEGAAPLHYIPSRSNGYGLSFDALEMLANEYYPDLIITVDCGITAIEEVEFARETLGIDIIVTDHHEPYEHMPDCIVVNPKLQKDNPLKDICGAGVALKLVEGLAGRKRALEYIDLACLATIADIVPLTGENRVIVYLGLQKLNRLERLGIKLLAQSIGANKFSARDIAYRIAPRINAPARMGNEALDILALFTSNEYFEVESVVAALNRDNERRQLLSERVYNEAIAALKGQRYEENSIIVLGSAAWDIGVLGLSAARIAKEFSRPAILLNAKGEYLKGSARSAQGVNLFECLTACSRHLEAYGGHAFAAGLTINIAKLDAFKSDIDAYIKAQYPNMICEPVYEYDIELKDKKEIDEAFFKQLEQFEPTGEGNPQPIIYFRDEIAKPTRIGNTAHVRLRLNKEAEGVAFNSSMLLLASYGAEFDLLGRCFRDTYRNNDFISVKVSDIIVRDISRLIDSPDAYYAYLKTISFGAGKIAARFIRPEDILQEAKERGTLFVAYSAKSAKSFVSEYNQVLPIYFNAPKPCDRGLLVYPECTDFALFRKVVLLDAPLSTGFIAEAERIAPETEFVCATSYGFKMITQSIDISDEAIGYTYDFLTKCAELSVLEGGAEKLFDIITKYGYQGDSFCFAAHLAILLDCSAVSHISARLSVDKVKWERSASRAVKTLENLRK